MVLSKFKHAAVIVADIVEFTKMSSSMNPLDIVKMLNACFAKFFFPFFLDFLH